LVIEVLSLSKELLNLAPNVPSVDKLHAEIMIEIFIGLQEDDILIVEMKDSKLET
jgi:hypothetical protein